MLPFSSPSFLHLDNPFTLVDHLLRLCGSHRLHAIVLGRDLVDVLSGVFFHNKIAFNYHLNRNNLLFETIWWRVVCW